MPKREERNMSLNQLFDTVEKTRETAHWRAAFGEPQVFEDKTVIPVARVGYTFGMGFGSGTRPSEEEGKPAPVGEGGGGGGGASAKPLGVIVITPECVYFEQTEDWSKIALAGIGVAALFILQFGKTVRMIFGRR
jgi:uncharacterized spore protein YtfJ